MNLKMEQKAKSFNYLFFSLFFILLIWCLLQFSAPLALPSQSVNDLSGSSIFYDNAEIIDDMGFPWGGIYSAGDVLCHQKAERSFFLNGNQMPVCARCIAIWVGIVLGLGITIIYPFKLDVKFFSLFIICLLPLAVDGMGQLIGFWESSNAVRLITGLAAGISCGFSIQIIFAELTSFYPKGFVAKKN